LHCTLPCRRDYDKDISKLLDDIPRATSAPPHLAHLAGVSRNLPARPCMGALPTLPQLPGALPSPRPAAGPPAAAAARAPRAITAPCETAPAAQANADAVNGQRWAPFEHADIRFDEDYPRFFETFGAQQRNLPPPVNGRTLYHELPALLHQQKLQQAVAQQAMLNNATPPPNAAQLLMAHGSASEHPPAWRPPGPGRCQRRAAAAPAYGLPSSTRPARRPGARAAHRGQPIDCGCA
jgi:hypothetical protein